jgi:hypothetical protein
MGDPARMVGKEKTHRELRVRGSDVLYGLGETSARRHIVLKNQKMSAIGDICQALQISEPGIRWISRVGAYFNCKRIERLA